MNAAASGGEGIRTPARHEVCGNSSGRRGGLRDEPDGNAIDRRPAGCGAQRRTLFRSSGFVRRVAGCGLADPRPRDGRPQRPDTPAPRRRSRPERAKLLSSQRHLEKLAPGLTVSRELPNLAPCRVGNGDQVSDVDACLRLVAPSEGVRTDFRIDIQAWSPNDVGREPVLLVGVFDNSV